VCVNNLPRVALDGGGGWDSTRNLLIASPASYHYADEQLIKWWTTSHVLLGHWRQDFLAGTRMSPFWILTEVKLMEVVSGDNWTCKAPVKSSTPTNQQADFYRPDALPVAQPTVSQH